MAIGIRDIAEAAGVSPSTVSLVINNKPGVGGDTRRRILAIAREMQYDLVRSRNLSSQSQLRTIRFLRVSRHGHVVNDDHAVFIANYIDGLGIASKQLGLNLEILTIDDGPISSIVDACHDPHIGGYIVLATEMTMSEIAEFGGIKTPLIFMDNFSETLNFDFVDMNNKESVFMAIDHLVGYGHREIGIVTSNVSTPNFRMRAEAFEEALRLRGISFNPSYAKVVDSTFSGAYEDMKRHLASGAPLPTAFFCANDIMAFGTMRAIKEAGLRIPQDISVVGFDNLPSSSMIDPPLTSVEVSKVQIGEFAVKALHYQMESEGRAPHAKILVSGDLVVRSSVRRI